MVLFTTNRKRYRWVRISSNRSPSFRPPAGSYSFVFCFVFTHSFNLDYVTHVLFFLTTRRCICKIEISWCVVSRSLRSRSIQGNFHRVALASLVLLCPPPQEKKKWTLKNIVKMSFFFCFWLRKKFFPLSKSVFLFKIYQENWKN